MNSFLQSHSTTCLESVQNFSLIWVIAWNLKTQKRVLTSSEKQKFLFPSKFSKCQFCCKQQTAVKWMQERQLGRKFQWVFCRKFPTFPVETAKLSKLRLPRCKCTVEKSGQAENCQTATILIRALEQRSHDAWNMTQHLVSVDNTTIHQRAWPPVHISLKSQQFAANDYNMQMSWDSSNLGATGLPK